MKLSRQTIEILKHCAKINDGLIIRPIGKEPDRIIPPPGSIRTISSNKAVLYEASVPEVFPPDTVIQPLRSMLNTLDEHTEIDFQYSDRIELKNGRSVTKLPRVDAKLVMAPPSKTLVLPACDEKIFLHVDDLEEILSKKANRIVTKRKDVVFYSEGKGKPIVVDVKQDDFVRTIECKVPRTASQPFYALLTLANLNLMKGSYEVEIFLMGVTLTRWRWLHGDVTTYIAIESKRSWFGEKERDEKLEKEHLRAGAAGRADLAVQQERQLANETSDGDKATVGVKAA